MTDHGRDHADTALDERVSALLSAAAAPSEPGPLPGEGAARAAYRASLTPTRRRSVISSFSKARTGLAAAVGAGVLLTGGVTTAAAAGGLPGAAQNTVSDVLLNFGIDVPRAAAVSNDHADTRGKSTDARADEPAGEPDDAVVTTDTEVEASDGEPAAESDDADATESNGKGEAVSGLATSIEDGGVEKGAAISTYASGGKSQAGQEHGESRETHARPEGAGSAAEHGKATSAEAKAPSDDADEAEDTEDTALDESDDVDDDADEASDDHRQDASRH